AVEEHVGEPLVPIEAREAADGHAGGVQGDEEVGQAAVPLRLRVGAEQSEQVGAEGASGGPGLLPGQPPPAGLLVPFGAAADAGEVTAGHRLRPALTPQIRSEEHTSGLQSREELVCRLLL